MYIIKAAVEYVGVPYVIHGRDLSGWDCWGCVSVLRDRLFGKPTPSWVDAYNAVDFQQPDKIADIISARMEGWREVEVRSGAVLLLKLFDIPCHVGLYLERGQFIHAQSKCDTVIVPLESWNNRFVAAYDTE